jgi:hypothetical protein
MPLAYYWLLGLRRMIPKFASEMPQWLANFGIEALVAREAPY